MSTLFVLPPGPTFDHAAKQNWIAVACDRCFRKLQFDQVFDKSTLAQNGLMFFSLREDPDAAYFFSRESADAGSKSAGWIVENGMHICNRCRRAA